MTVSEAETHRIAAIERIGVTRVQFGDRSVEYSDALKEIAFWDSEIARLTGQSQPIIRQIRVSTSRGL